MTKTQEIKRLTVRYTDALTVIYEVGTNKVEKIVLQAPSYMVRKKEGWVDVHNFLSAEIDLGEKHENIH